MKKSSTDAPVILFVDDEQRVLKSLQRIMTYEPFCVRTAVSAAEAMKILKTEHVDAVVSDEKMPEKTGSEFLSEVRALYPHVCRIMLTGQAELSSAVQAINEGRIFRFLLKPVKLEELVSAIAECLDEKFKSEQVFKLSQHTAGVCSLEMNVSSEGQTLFRWSANARFMFELGEDAPLDSMDILYQRVHPDDLEKVRSLEKQGTEFSLSPENEYRIVLPGGRVHWISQINDGFRSADGRGYTILAVLKDITESRKHRELLHYQAYHDSLTGLGNRALFMDEVQKVLSEKGEAAVLFLDLDDFKLVNDSMGHGFGDWLLKSFSKRLKETIPEHVLPARLGGDEFSLLVPGVCADEACGVASMIMDSLTRPFRLDDYEIHVCASIGVSAVQGRNVSVNDLLREADTAMYSAKGLGECSIKIFDSSMHDKAADRFRLNSELHRALQRDEFFMEYQPVVDLKTLKPVGFEALVRWNHPERGIVMPDSFISVAEESGIIISLGMRVAELSCRQAGIWIEENPQNNFFMSFNISVKQFHQAAFVEKLENIIHKTGITPDRLKVEITESGIMDDVDLSMKIMNRMKELGLGLQIDDFGTGYSSLEYLQRIPASNLKIDKSFVSGMNVDPDKFAIVRTIIDLARSVGMKTVAEGVEKVEELSLLRQLGCDYVQGYLFDRPLRSKAAAEVTDYRQFSRE